MLEHAPTTPDPSGFNLSSAFLLLSISGGVVPREPGPGTGFVPIQEAVLLPLSFVRVSI